ncbi:hypothetical protein VCRA2120O435_90142 [Vibrio crassostreae]|nr:hypothetical protein VCRA2121O437_100144 [Vibrio crassostreae]CAK3152451.1 hypothetical protein VCRA2127O449_100142 [Vibrio crassostreae]CAK3155363.1 hypothetical protein VCRA2120O433_100024 [Vibrio crassostreae]CAK3986897.1 hypothetical protein VCRA2120O435_90142 [Vibrio crassostreae]
MRKLNPAVSSSAKVMSLLAGLELWSIIKYGQFDNPEGLSCWKQLYALAT